MEEDRHGVWYAGQELVGVTPCDGAKRGLHPPAHRGFEHAANDGANQEDDEEVLFIEAVEGHRKKYGAKAVDGAKGTKEQARAVLVDAGVNPNHMEDDLDNKA